MNTSLTASIKPQFRMIDGIKIRYADSGGPPKPTILLTSPWPESLYAFARRGTRSPNTRACSPSTSPASADPSAETICCPHGRWAASS